MFQITPDSALIKGGPLLGSAQQIMILKRNMEKLGHSVFVSGDSDVDLSDVDVVHITMIGFESTRTQWLNCQKQNVPVVVKTINSWSSAAWLRDFARNAAALTVESPDEGRMAKHKFGPFVEHKLCYLLPAVDDRIVNQFVPWKDKSLVHINGAYDNNKGHYSVIKACQELGLPVVTAGAVVDSEVYQKCLDLGYGDIRTELNKQELSEIYNQTRVYVCASEKEICNTSICEAIKCGSQIVSSSTNWGNTNYSGKGFSVYQYASDKSLESNIWNAYYSDGVQENQFWDETKLTDEYLKVFRKVVNRKCFL